MGSSGGGVCSRRDRRKVPKEDERLRIDCRHERFFSTFAFVMVGDVGENDHGETGEMGDFSLSPGS